ncbi:hypothetical protein L873DRAFT_1790559 [Choiromyces venosus 120613-1]|uniref:Actin binding protein n=1 Tax=Choiromyces venosus 120613-1 TaxID=1336337 RepID=A0A3N4JIF4_9PEZI|nr:hypothetical protein L873DRAFT_1790559 [Choiromyces venosus 120613-1]
MTSLDISHEIGRSYQTLVNSPPANKPSATYAQWAVFTVSAPLVNAFVAASASKASVLKVHSTAEGELQDLIDEFNDGKVQFAFVKVKDANTSLAKFVLIAWCGEGVPERVKGYFTGHLNAVSKVLHGYHVQITARSESDLSPESILQKVADASSAKYSAGSSTSGPPPTAPKPAVSAYKPAYQPTKVSGGSFNLGSSRSPYKRGENTDSDGWGADAPPVTRSQLEKVSSAYTPTKVDIAALRAQPTSTTSGSGSGSNPDVVKGGYQPIGKVDIAALRAQGQKQDRPDIVKGTYEPIGKVDIAAIRAQARPRPSVNAPSPRSNAPPAQEEERPKSLTERSAAFSQSERLTSLPKPKPTKKFGAGAPAFGTKPPTPSAFGISPSVPATPPVGAASRDFGSSGGKTPAQLWAEKKARERGTSGASETTPPTLSPGYTGQHHPPVSTSTTGRSGGSADGLPIRLPQQRFDSSQSYEEEVQTPAGGIGALRNKFAGAPPMGVPVSPKSPQRTGGFHDTEREVPPPPPIDISSRPPPAPAVAILPPPVQPRSPTPPTPDAPGSPVRIAMPVARQSDSPPVAKHEPEPQVSMPTESLARVVPDERELQEEPARHRGAAVGVSAGGEGASDQRAMVLYDYEAAEENEISLVEGQVVGEIDQVDDDWWAGRNAAGEHGLFPSNYVELMEDTGVVQSPPRAPTESPEPKQLPAHQPAQDSNETAIALYDYEAAEENELSFPEDAIIEDLEFPDEDWWLGTYKGNRGLFPANYVQRQ